MIWGLMKKLLGPTRVYVLREGTYYKVVGPQEMLDRIKGAGGHIIVGDELVLAATVLVGGEFGWL